MERIEKKNKLAIIAWSGTIDKLYPVAILSSAAAASGWEVEIFFTFWGLNAIRKDALKAQPKVEQTYSEYAQAVGEAIGRAGLPAWHELLSQAKSMGKVTIYACSTTMELFGIRDKSALADFVDEVVGAATFLEKAKDAAVTLFI
ncbi:DsrE/DsrF/DrsH-like family protein [Thermoproteus tenax]|uniref:Peroxiredoxin family protein n=1 Tax=Thermoproteus tenax (strain ATCC 35583 / DSM 2078 / JCM 9277 / NBRC 100435 / Kra 1) TaxID=768679 RepID=G4RND7_THETK|nr:DsrE/DsrF/DrsH-like family protein [Thermoproteus tenax]CCC81081.1 peroxiredoxin family protein [Thermoproteus tenax Kra 1]